MKKLSLFATVLLGLTISFSSCKKDATGGGGDSNAPLLKKTYIVSLGAESDINNGSYLASSKGVVYKSANAVANIDIIDITFGYGGDNMEPACAGAEKLQVASFVSPDIRSCKETALNFGSQDSNGSGGNIVTFFNKEANLTDLEDADITPEYVNDIKETGSKTMSVVEGEIYSFSNSLGKKGLIHIDKIEGDKKTAVATISVITQE